MNSALKTEKNHSQGELILNVPGLSYLNAILLTLKPVFGGGRGPERCDGRIHQISQGICCGALRFPLLIGSFFGTALIGWKAFELDGAVIRFCSS